MASSIPEGPCHFWEGGRPIFIGRQSMKKVVFDAVYGTNGSCFVLLQLLHLMLHILAGDYGFPVSGLCPDGEIRDQIRLFCCNQDAYDGEYQDYRERLESKPEKSDSNSTDDNVDKPLAVTILLTDLTEAFSIL